MKALVIGGATIDVITSIDSSEIERITLHNASNSYLMMEQGKKIESGRIDHQIGGGAANASVCLARLGWEVSSLIKVGCDNDGDLIQNRLSCEGVDTGYLIRDARLPTGKSVVITSHDRNSGVFVARGANTLLSDVDISPDHFDNIDLVYISTLSGESVNVFGNIAKKAKEAGAFVVANPGVIQLSQNTDQTLSALKCISLLALNVDEARVLSSDMNLGDVTTHPLQEAENLPQLLSSESDFSLGGFAREILKSGPKYLLITNGEEGAYLCSEDTIIFRPAVACDVESSTGAGDAFNATFAGSIVEQKTVYSALSTAAVNAASVAQSADTQSGLMLSDDLLRRVLPMDSSRVQTYRIEEREIHPEVA